MTAPSVPHRHKVRRYVNALAEMSHPDPWITVEEDCAAGPNCRELRLEAALKQTNAILEEGERMTGARSMNFVDWQDRARDVIVNVARKALTPVSEEGWR